MNTTPAKPLRRYVLEGLRGLAYWSGLAHPGNRPGGATILMYHSIAAPGTDRFIDPAWSMAPSAFERQMQFVANCCRAVSMNDLVETLRCGRRPRPRTVVITFDDGYVDNLSIATPILARYKLPATLYLPTRYTAHAEPQWVDRLYTAFISRERDLLWLDQRAVNLANPRQRLLAYRTLSDRLRKAVYEQRQCMLAEVEHELRSSAVIPALTLSWDQVRELKRRYPRFEIGVHSQSHLDLSSHDEETVRTEVHGCIEDVKRELGTLPVHFSFPYGRANGRAKQIVMEAGLHSAVCAGTRLQIDEHSDRLCLTRLDANLSPTQFRFWSTGAYAALPERLTRV